MSLKTFVTLAVTGIAICFATYTATSQTSTVSGPVVHSVVDGDTITVLVNGKKEKVRLIGIDTPETVHPGKPVGCYGKEASNFTKSLLPKDTAVNIVLDVEARDHYGRLLAYIYRESDGMFVNAELARQGFAQPLTIPPNIAHTEQFTRLSTQARSENRGLWASCADP